MVPGLVERGGKGLLYQACYSEGKKGGWGQGKRRSWEVEACGKEG